MGSNKIFYDTRILEKFHDVYNESAYICWSLFIKEQNLGIICLQTDYYLIKDEKKWLINKIKYGF